MSNYAQTFRDAYALLHGGRPHEPDDTPERLPAEPLEQYLARTRSHALGATRQRLLAADPPPGLETVHRLLLDLLQNAALADEALAQQVAAYQCGAFHESVAHSQRLHGLIEQSARLDRDLITALRSLPPHLAAQLGLTLPD